MLNRNPINGRFISGSNAAGAGNSAGSSSGSLPDWFDRFLGNSTAGASSAIQNSTRALVSAFAFLVGAIWSGGGRLIGAFGTVALFLTGALLGGLGAFVGGVRSIVSEATGLARNLALIRAQTGYSFSQGYGITSRFQLAGISPQTTTGLLSNPAMNPLLARIRGVDLQNPDFLPQMADNIKVWPIKGRLDECWPINGCASSLAATCRTRCFWLPICRRAICGHRRRLESAPTPHWG